MAGRLYRHLPTLVGAAHLLLPAASWQGCRHLPSLCPAAGSTSLLTPPPLNACAPGLSHLRAGRGCAPAWRGVPVFFSLAQHWWWLQCCQTKPWGCYLAELSAMHCPSAPSERLGWTQAADVQNDASLRQTSNLSFVKLCLLSKGASSLRRASSGPPGPGARLKRLTEAADQQGATWSGRDAELELQQCQRAEKSFSY